LLQRKLLEATVLQRVRARKRARKQLLRRLVEKKKWT